MSRYNEGQAADQANGFQDVDQPSGRIRPGGSEGGDPKFNPASVDAQGRPSAERDALSAEDLDRLREAVRGTGTRLPGC